MKTLFKLKLVLILFAIGFLISCKDNKDGYSDQIDTTQTPFDTASADTTKTGPGANSTPESGTQNQGVTGAQSNSSSQGSSTNQKTTANEGTGPGPSAKDGAAYDISSQTKKDTTKLGRKANAKVLKEKEAKK